MKISDYAKIEAYLSAMTQFQERVINILDSALEEEFSEILTKSNSIDSTKEETNNNGKEIVVTKVCYPCFRKLNQEFGEAYGLGFCEFCGSQDFLFTLIDGGDDNGDI